MGPGGKRGLGVWGFPNCGPEDSRLLRSDDVSLDASPTAQNVLVPSPSGSNNTKRSTAQPPETKELRFSETSKISHPTTHRHITEEQNDRRRGLK